MSIRAIELYQQPDADGIARLNVPVPPSDQRYRFIVLVEPESEAIAKRQWSPGFFERTFGQWQGDLERAPKGEPEKREEF